MKIIFTSLFVVMLAGAALADLSELIDSTRQQPTPSAPTTSSDAVDGGGLLVTVVVPKIAVRGEPLAISVEMKNTLKREVRVYADTSRWSWRFEPLSFRTKDGFYELRPQFAEVRVISGTIKPGESLTTVFATRSKRGPEYVFVWSDRRMPLVPDETSLPVGRHRLTISMKLGTFSRPTSQPEPWEGDLTTKPVEFEVIRQAPPTSQPAALSPADTKVAVELIGRLTHRGYGVREEATKKLAEMGEAVRPLLKAKLQEKDLDPEVATRIQSVLEKTNPAGHKVTDEATGLTVAILPNDVIAAFQNERVVWQMRLGGAAPTSLKIVDGQVIVQPGNWVIDVTNGKIIERGNP